MLGKVMNLKNVQRAICFAVGLVCLIASSGDAWAVTAATITNISAVTIPDAMYGAGSTATKNALVIGPQSFNINFNGTITQGFRIELSVSNASFTGTPTVSGSVTGCTIGLQPDKLLILGCDPNSGGITGLTVSGISYNNASALATSGTSISLGGQIKDITATVLFSNITSTAVVTSSAPTSATLSIASSASASASSGSVALTVTRSGSTTGASTVSYSTSNGTATAGTNYTATSGTLSFAAGETSKTITVPILNSASQVSDLSFSVTLSSPSSGTTISNASGTVTVTAALKAATLAIASSASTNESLGSASVVVTRSGSLADSVSVNYATSNGTASAGSDFTAASGTLTFAANETSKTITVPLGVAPYYTHECTAAHGAKTFSVVLSNPSSNATITNSVSAITIAAVSSTPIQVSISPTASTSEAAGTVSLNVTRSGRPSVDIWVKYSISDGTAVAGSDYTPVLVDLMRFYYPDAATTKTITLPIIADSVAEGEEQFTVNITEVSGCAAIANAASVVTIAADAGAGPTLSIASSASASASSGSVALTVTRSGSTTGASTVNFATSNGTATAGANYTAVSGTLSFAANETSKTITVPILNSSTQSSDLSFSVTLSSPSSGTTISNASGTVTVTAAQQQSSTVSISSSASAAASSGSVALTVTRVGSTTGTSTVNFTTSNGTATAGTNYTATSGTLSFAANETSKTITVPIAMSSLQTSDLNFSVTLSSPSSGTTISNASGTVTVTASARGITNISAVTIPDAIYGTGTTATKNAAVIGPQSIQINFPLPIFLSFRIELSVSNASFTGTPTVSGSVTGCTIGLQPDKLLILGCDPNSGGITGLTVSGISYNNASALATSGTSISLGGQIKDITATVLFSNITSTAVVTSSAPTSATLSIASSASASASSGSVALTVTRSGSTTGASTVSYSTSNGTATAGTNYTATSGTLSFAAGETSKTITVPILNSASQVSDLSFSVTLSSPSSGTTISNASGTVTVTAAQQQSSTVSISSSASAAASSGSVALTVTRVGSTTGTSTVNFTTSNGTATAGTNYTATSGTLSFAANETSKTITVPIAMSSLQTSDLNFSVTLSSPSSGTTISNASGTVTVVAGGLALNGTNYAIIPSVWTGLNGNNSYIRLQNADTVAHTVALKLIGNTTGKVYGSASYSVAVAAAPQIPISQIISDSNASPLQGSDSAYQVYIARTTKVYFQHVIYNSLSTFFENVDTCSYPIGPDYSDLNNTLWNVHSSLFSNNYPAVLTFTNTENVQKPLRIDVFDAANGNQVGTWSTSLGANQSLQMSEIALEQQIGWHPSSSQFHINIKVSSGINPFTGFDPFTGLLEGLVINQSLVTSVNMSQGCPTSPPTGSASSITSLPSDTTLNGTNYAVIPGVWTGANGNNSYIRLQNADTASHIIGIKVVGNTTGSIYGTASYTVPIMAAPQLPIGQILTDANAGAFAGSDTGYSLYITQALNVTFQHVIYNSISTFFENVGTCRFRAGTDYTILNQVIWNAHTSLFKSNYPASFSVTNTDNISKPVRLDVYDASNGNLINGWGTTLSANQSLEFTEASLEQLIAWQPASNQFHINIKVSSGAGPFTGLLESLVTNQSLFTSVNMGQVCPTWGATLAADPANSPATLSIAGTASTSEAQGTVGLVVTRSGNLSSPVTVSYGTANGTAVAGSDYTQASGTLTFAANETSKTITVQILSDAVQEGAETFQVQLTNPSTGATITNNIATVTIAADPANSPATLSIAGTASTSEAQGTVGLVVTRSGNLSSPVTVSYGTANGTAVAGSDYTQASGTLTFAANETSKTITVQILSDAVQEGAETFQVQLTNPSTGATITNNIATVTIAADPANSPATPTPSGPTAYYIWGGAGYTVYLGNFTCWPCNEFGSESINNQFGNYGNQVSSTSIRNQFSQYGSLSSSYSACSQFALTPPRVFNSTRSILYGALTVNQFAANAITDASIVAWLTYNVCYH